MKAGVWGTCPHTWMLDAVPFVLARLTLQKGRDEHPETLDR